MASNSTTIESEPSKPKKSPWGAVPQASTEPLSLAEVMSEQLASDLMKKDFSEMPTNVETEIPPELLLDSYDEPEDCADDLLIAQMLQMQFDKEYDQQLTNEERQKNGTSKVSVSLSKYKMTPNNHLFEESEDEDEYFTMDDRKRHCDAYETAEKEMGGPLPRCGYRRINGEIVTKHDTQMSQRSNGKRVMEFPPGIETGDGGGFDMQLSNGVYNKIRNFSIKDAKRKNRIHDKEEKSTSEQAVDQPTKLLMFKMVNGGILDAINGIISTGKEAVIMHADGGPGPDEGGEDPLNVPKECAIKVFKTTLNEFKTRSVYIKDDYRFRNRFSKQNPRKVIHMWAEKEMHNLMKMAKFGIRVPEVVLLKKHVLVMQFIGRDGTAAPKLRDAILSSADAEIAYEEVVDTMKTMYNECHLVHADLSEYNILWHDKQCWFIDVSQSVEPNHPHGLEFLMRDCVNVFNFFNRRIKKCRPAHLLFTDITGLPISEGTDAEIQSQIQDYERNQEILSGLGESERLNTFEYCWEKSKAATEDHSDPRPIPGHSKNSKPIKTGKKSPKFGRSPSSSSLSKSPKSPKEGFYTMTDEELKKLKDNVTAEQIQRKSSQVKFQVDENTEESELD